MFRVGGDYAVVTFTKPLIQNMSRDDVLEDKLTQTFTKLFYIKNSRLFLKPLVFKISPIRSPPKWQNTKSDKFHPVLKGLTPSTLDSHKNVGSFPRPYKSRVKG